MENETIPVVPVIERGDTLTQLGKFVAIPQCPDDAILEVIALSADPKSGRLAGQISGGYAVVRFSAPEFTSLCPVTGQPDFAHIVIDYTPNHKLIESKSLKLFLNSFRNHKEFHENVAAYIGDRLVRALDPIWLRIGAYFYPRGGIPIDVFWSYGVQPAQSWCPDQNVPGYRGR